MPIASGARAGSLRRRSAGLGVAALALAVSGCSSSHGSASGQGSSLNLGGSSTTVAAGQTTVPGAGPTATTPGAQASGPAGSPVASSSGTGGTVSPAAGGTASAGGTATGGGRSSTGAAAVPAGCPNPEPTLTVGHYYAKPPASGSISTSIQGSVILDGQKAAQAVVDYVNAHGGAGCHKLALDGFGQVDGVDNQSTDDQAACTKFSRDDHVPVVLNVTTTTPNFYMCLARAGIPETESNYGNPDESAYHQYANYIFSIEMAQDRVGKTLAYELNRDGYFKAKGGVYALLYEDHPWFKASADAFAAQTAAYGVKLVTADPICNPNTATGASACDNSQLQAETVKLRSKGVNHVALLGITTAGWIGQASDQGYFPTLGITSQSDPDLISLNAPNPQSLQGAVGVGYFPGLDVQPGQDPYPTPGHQLCRQILFGGNNPPDAVAEAQGDGECDSVFLLKAILDKDHGNTAPAAMSAALYSLGSSYSPASTFGDTFGPGRNDGGSRYVPLAYQSGCQCFRYVGSPQPTQG